MKKYRVSTTQNKEFLLKNGSKIQKLRKKIEFLSIYKIFRFWYKNTRFTFSGSKQFRFFYKNIQMFHKKDIVCKIITTESVIAPKLVFFFVEKCYTDAMDLFFFDSLKGFH